MSAFVSQDGGIHFIIPAEAVTASATPETSPDTITRATETARPTTSARARSSGDAENLDPGLEAASGPQRRARRSTRSKAGVAKKTKKPDEDRYRRVLGRLDRQATHNREFTLADIYYGLTTPREE